MTLWPCGQRGLGDKRVRVVVVVQHVLWVSWARVEGCGEGCTMVVSVGGLWGVCIR